MINFKNTRLLGHRGARGEALENTFSGFEYSQNLKAQGLSGIEFDIQLNADGHLIVFHDDDLERMCGLQSRVNQLRLNEIRCRLQFGQPIMTLATVAPLLSEFAVIELEVKTHNRTGAISGYYLRYFPSLSSIYLIFITIFKTGTRPRYKNVLILILS